MTDSYSTYEFTGWVCGHCHKPSEKPPNPTECCAADPVASYSYVGPATLADALETEIRFKPRLQENGRWKLGSDD